MALILIRHTRLAHTEGLCYGNSEVPLADSFEAEAAEVLDKAPVADLILTSPRERCQALGGKLASRHPSAQLVIDVRLSEMDFGNWQGLSWDQVPRAEVDLWAQDFFRARPHGGESVAMVETRVRDLLTEFASRIANETVIAVTHKGLIRAALAVTGQPDPWQFDPGFGDVIQL